MGKVTNLLFRFFRRSRGGYAAPRAGVSSSLGTGREGAMTVATVYRCVQLLSDSVASLPMQYMRRRGEVYRADTGSRMHYLLNIEPDTAMSAADFWRRVVQLVLLDGNAYIVPVYEGARLERLVVCGRATVAHDTINDTYTVTDLAAGISGTFDESEILHLKGATLRDPKRGVGVIAFARQTIDLAATGESETLDRFTNGGSVRGIVSNEKVNGSTFGQYKKTELDRTAGSIDERFRAGERIVSVPGDVHFSQLTMSAADMQFLESRRFTVREVCRFFGVHPSFVFDETSNNYKSAEQASAVFLSFTLNPLLRSIENEFQRKLVPEGAQAKVRFQFDRRGLYACDLDSRMRYVSQTIANGIYSVNDWRREENREPVPGGDTLFVSANLRTINEITDNRNNTE